MKTLLIGIGAAGNKAVIDAIENGSVKIQDTVLINSTSKDFPAEYDGTKIIISPNDAGAGKERSVAKNYIVNAIKAGKLNDVDVSGYTTVVICTSVEGGTGSGATPMVAKFFNQVAKKNVHVIAFTGFEEDVRGLSNTIEFFKELDSSMIVQTIRNASFLRQTGGNKFKAEQLANLEMAKRIEVITGKDFVPSTQNIDDTDILKVSNTTGYMTVEHRMFDKALVDQDEFNRLVKKMLYDSHSIQSKNPGATRIGIILNIAPESEDAIDYTFADIKAAYGNPYESFLQKQWDGKKEYIEIIASGMQMPIDEIQAIYDRYIEGSGKVNKNSDEFFASMNAMEMDETNSAFDMIKPKQKGTSIDEFLKNNS